MGGLVIFYDTFHQLREPTILLRTHLEEGCDPQALQSLTSSIYGRLNRISGTLEEALDKIREHCDELLRLRRQDLERLEGICKPPVVLDYDPSSKELKIQESQKYLGELNKETSLCLINLAFLVSGYNHLSLHMIHTVLSPILIEMIHPSFNEALPLLNSLLAVAPTSPDIPSERQFEIQVRKLIHMYGAGIQSSILRQDYHLLEKELSEARRAITGLQRRVAEGNCEGVIFLELPQKTEIIFSDNPATPKDATAAPSGSTIFSVQALTQRILAEGVSPFFSPLIRILDIVDASIQQIKVEKAAHAQGGKKKRK